jgi:phosphatidylglycerophosphate synthase
MVKEDLNYFSEKEKKSMRRFKEGRTKFFMPICRILMRLGITANAISYFLLFILIGFIYFVESNPILACVFLLAHVLLDALDGPLARLMKQDGNSGAFTDILCDHTGMAVVIITLIYVNLVSPFLAAIYIYLYTIMIIFVIVRNKMKIPAKLIFRTKYYMYILYGIWAFFNVNYLDHGLIVFSILMLPTIITSYFAIKKKLK